MDSLIDEMVNRLMAFGQPRPGGNGRRLGQGRARSRVHMNLMTVAHNATRWP